MNAFRRKWAVMAGLLLLGRSVVLAQQVAPAQKTFASAQEALAALRAAVQVHDKAALAAIFGPQIRDLLTGDQAQDKANSKRFAKAMEEGAAPVSEGDDKIILEIGERKWPFPIPLIKSGSLWHFDTAAGKEEIINRHIGKDELHAIGFCEAYAKGQKRADDLPSKPFHGYLFKTLAEPVAAISGGFALAAYPEHWGRSGIMTFMVNQDGKIYQRDLGEKTRQIVLSMAQYNADGGWTVVKDEGVVEK